VEAEDQAGEPKERMDSDGHSSDIEMEVILRSWWFAEEHRWKTPF
jgi:hypothetical protein